MSLVSKFEKGRKQTADKGRRKRWMDKVDRGKKKRKGQEA